MDALLLIALGWAAGGLVNGLAGFGVAMVAMPLVAGSMGMATAVPSCTLITLAANAQVGWSMRGHLAWPRVGPLLLGAAPGAILGVTLLRSLPEAMLKGGMALFIVGYAAWGLLCEAGARRVLSRWWGCLAGLLSALFGTAFGFNGPPLVAYVALSGLEKNASKAVLGAGFVGTGVVMAAAQAAAGLYTGHALLVVLVSIPATMAGVHLGSRLSARLGERSYRTMVFVLLLAMGSHILWGLWRAA